MGFFRKPRSDRGGSNELHSLRQLGRTGARRPCGRATSGPVFKFRAAARRARKREMLAPRRCIRKKKIREAAKLMRRLHRAVSLNEDERPPRALRAQISPVERSRGCRAPACWRRCTPARPRGRDIICVPARHLEAAKSARGAGQGKVCRRESS